MNDELSSRVRGKNKWRREVGMTRHEGMAMINLRKSQADRSKQRYEWRDQG
jgi:hypothetical protein